MPETATTRRVRALRGSAAATVATTVASTGHTIGGGDAPPLWLLLAVAVLASPLAVALVGRRRSLPRLAAAIAAAQVALHASFAAVGASVLETAGGHVHMSTPTLGTGPVATMTHLSADMLGGHIAAALVTIAALAYGERLLLMIAHGIRRLLARTGEVVPGDRPCIPRITHRTHTGATALFLSVLTRRGPPAFAR